MLAIMGPPPSCVKRASQEENERTTRKDEGERGESPFSNRYIRLLDTDIYALDVEMR